MSLHRADSFWPGSTSRSGYLAYAELAGIAFFPDLLPLLGIEPWDRFYDVAETADEISIHRPFYPFRPGGTSRDQLHSGLGLDRTQLRRRCEGNDAATMFWTLGGNQVGKAALSGWRYLAAAPRSSYRLWPFEGDLTDLLDDGGTDVVTETYPREFYQHFRISGGSKQQQEDRLDWMPGLLAWAQLLGVEWEPEILQRVQAGFSERSIGEDEFDAVVGLLGMIAVATGQLESGEPDDDPAVKAVEGWILGRSV